MIMLLTGLAFTLFILYLVKRHHDFPHKFGGGGINKLITLVFHSIVGCTYYPVSEFLAWTKSEKLMIGFMRTYLRWMVKLSGYATCQADVKTTLESFGDVQVYVHVPRQRESDAALLYLHGGGFVMFSADEYQSVTSKIAERSKTIVVSVEYRSAPEHPFPAAPDDCEKAYEYLVHHASEYNIDPNKIFVGGDSAGGNLAAVATRRARDRIDLPTPKGVVMIYPVTQIASFNLPGHRECSQLGVESCVIYPEAVARMWVMYLGVERSFAPILLEDKQMHPDLMSSEVYKTAMEGVEIPAWIRHIPKDQLTYKHKKFIMDEDVSPLFIRDPSGMPPTLVITCGYDFIRDDGYLIAERWKSFGVDVEHVHRPNATHGAFNVDDLIEGAAMHKALAQFLLKHS